MARTRLNVLSAWQDCHRCQRCGQREAVVAQRWPRGVRVVLLDTSMPVETQLFGALPPRLLDRARELAERLGLAGDEVVADALVACGAAESATPDEVAACAARFLEHQRGGSRPDLMVFLGRHTYALARRAGLIDAAGWSPLGWNGRVPVLLADGNVDDLVAAVANALRLQPAASPLPRSPLMRTMARPLLEVLGPHARHRIDAGSGWTTRGRPLRQADVERHLMAELAVGADSPDTTWPYVVLDLDRHDCVQAERFETTLKSVRRLFPQAFYVRSSASGGVHVYLKLPPKVRYLEAVKFMRVFLNVKGVRWYEANSVMTEVVEVPPEPPRLPFGPGSYALDIALPLEAQVMAFIGFVTSGSTRDYEGACRQVWQRVSSGTDRRFTPAVGRRLRALEGMPLTPATPPRLDPADPWSGLILRLSEELHEVGALGVPAYGTRTEYTRRLINELPQFIDESEAIEFVEHWLYLRRHKSKDWAGSGEAVARKTLEMVHDRYGRGLPLRAWRHIHPLVLAGHAHVIRSQRARVAIARDQLVATAFSVATKFFLDAAGERAISRFELEKFCRSDSAGTVRRMLEHGRWLLPTRPPVRRQRASMYRLAVGLWPARPGEPVIHRP